MGLSVAVGVCVQYHILLRLVSRSLLTAHCVLQLRVLQPALDSGLVSVFC
jgi:hypothetical protein